MALSELQGSWSNLRRAVVDNFGFPNSDKLLFHIDKAMSYELEISKKPKRNEIYFIIGPEHYCSGKISRRSYRIGQRCKGKFRENF